MALSYSQGIGTTPLLGETIGANFDRAVAAFPDRDALISRHQGVRLTYGELAEAVDGTARGIAGLGLGKGDRLGIWSPNCAEWVVAQFATAKLGVILVNINPAYRTTELAYALRQSGCKALISATEFKTSDYRAMVDEVRGDLPDLEHVVFLGDEAHQTAARRPRRDRVARARLRRADQHPVHERHHRLAQGRDALAPQHPQQRLLRGRVLQLHRAGPRLHPGALLPLLRHGHGQPRGRHPRRLHGHPGAGLRAEGDARGGRRGALHEPLRRADDVHRRARAPRLRLLRPELAADRDHGRLAVPRAGHAQGHRPHAHGGRDHLLRHDRDLARLDPDDRRGRARAPRRHGRARAPARRGQGRRAGDRPHRRARRAGRAVHARLLGDARLLGGPRAHRGGDRPGALDAHRRPRDDG